MIRGIDHVHVTVKNMAECIDFYTGVLGFRLLRRISFGPPENRRELAYVGLGDVLLELLQPEDGGAPAGTATYPFALAVDDLATTLADLRRRGVAVSMELRPGFSFTGLVASIKDPSGLSIELREWQGPDSPHYSDWRPERIDVVRSA